MRALTLVDFGFLFVLFVLVVSGFAAAQSRTVVYDGTAPTLTALHASPNGDGTYTVQVCARAPADTGPALEACETFGRVASAGNVNRLDALRDNFLSRWLARQSFPVDAGAAP